MTRDKCAIDAGHKSEQDMEEQLGRKSEFEAEAL